MTRSSDIQNIILLQYVLNKYACHIAYIYSIALPLQCTHKIYIGAHITKNKQGNITFIHHAIVIYVPSTKCAPQVPHVCHIFKLVCPNETTMAIHMLLINPLELSDQEH